jgi:putative MATE family efflux protein
MTPPMAAGMFAMMAFNLTDTWYISRLGVKPLAAMGFTFPVVMLFHAFAMGLGLGTSSCVSRAIGSRNGDKVQSLATYSLLLGFCVMFAFTVTAWIPLRMLFLMLGAEGETLEMTLGYMRTWFLFAPVAALPMIGNNAIRATGDTLRPGIIMSIAAGVNIVLDPIFIFGWGPVGAMGMKGAALATGLSRLITVFWSIYIMHHHKQLITLRWHGAARLLISWREILSVAIPASGTNILMPITMGLVTRLIASHGEHAVAATAAGQRIEMFSYIIPIAIGSVLVPVIGQNWGGGKIARVRSAYIMAVGFGIGYAAICFVLSFPLGPLVAGLFSDTPRVIELIVRYIRIILAGSAFMHIIAYTGFAFNAIHKPLSAALLTIIRLVGLVIPFAWIGSRTFGITGIYGGISSAHVVCGIFALTWFTRTLNTSERKSCVMPGTPLLQKSESAA